METASFLLEARFQGFRVYRACRAYRVYGLTRSIGLVGFIGFRGDRAARWMLAIRASAFESFSCLRSRV